MSHRFVKKSKSNFSQWATIGEHSITIPPRPFLKLTAGEISEIELAAMDFLVSR